MPTLKGTDVKPETFFMKLSSWKGAMTDQACFSLTSSIITAAQPRAIGRGLEMRVREGTNSRIFCSKMCPFCDSFVILSIAEMRKKM